MAGGLTAAWVQLIPPLFRSTAMSIETHRARLVGDSAALRARSALFQEQADRVDAVWQHIDQDRRTVEGNWHGNSATAFDRAVVKLDGQLSFEATSLRYAANGLELAAGKLDKTRHAADAIVLAYVQAVNARFHQASAVTGPAAATALTAAAQQIMALSAETLRKVFAEEAELDAMLWSLRPRFTANSKSAWRRSIPVASMDKATTEFAAAVTMFGVRTTRREGMTITHLADGRVSISFNDSYAMGLHAKVGKKLSFADLPAGVREAMVRVYGEAEAAPVLSYQQRYNFKNQAEADAFLRRLDGTNVLDRIGSAVRNGAGFVTGPIADFNPLHEQLLGRKPDEVTLNLGVGAKVSGDAGVWPVAGAAATSNYQAGVMFSHKADGTSSLLSSTSAQIRAGGTLADITGTAGTGQQTIVRVDYDKAGHPVRYLSQDVTDGHFAYNQGTNNTGITVVPPSSDLKDGIQVKADDDRLARSVTSHYLDLTNKQNLDLFHQAQGNLRMDPLPGAVGAFGDQVHNHGLQVVEQYAVHRGMVEGSAKLTAGATEFSVKGGPASETLNLIDSRYNDQSRSDGLYLNPSALRPTPQ